jgi:hypothetical protein
MVTKDFQKQLLHLINKIEKIEDLCKELSPESYMNEPCGPYQEPDFHKLLETSKKLSFTDGMEAGEEFLARKILRILYER